MTEEQTQEALKKVVTQAATLTMMDIINNLDIAAKSLVDMYKTIVRNDPEKMRELSEGTTKVLDKINNLVMDNGKMKLSEVILASITYARATSYLFLEDINKEKKPNGGVTNEGTNSNN